MHESYKQQTRTHFCSQSAPFKKTCGLYWKNPIKQEKSDIDIEKFSEISPKTFAKKRASIIIFSFVFYHANHGVSNEKIIYRAYFGSFVFPFPYFMRKAAAYTRHRGSENDRNERRSAAEAQRRSQNCRRKRKEGTGRFLKQI